jgi:hypothetical protein
MWAYADSTLAIVHSGDWYGGGQAVDTDGRWLMSSEESVWMRFFNEMIRPLANRGG